MDDYRARWERDVRMWSAIIDATAPARRVVAKPANIVLTQLCISPHVAQRGVVARPNDSTRTGVEAPSSRVRSTP